VSRQTLSAAAEAGEIADGIDTDRESALLFFMIQGLIGPILIGILSPADALALLDHQLDRIFR
jgi:TetR/AcrR family transcriptional regulator, transcriptional repressor of bet genes